MAIMRRVILGWALGCVATLGVSACKSNDPVAQGTVGPGQACEASGDCDDGNVCNGQEQCGPQGTCVAGAPALDGTACENDQDPMTVQICRGAKCEVSRCGDGFRDVGAGEFCDDGNTTDGDGCDATCTVSCEADADCDNGAMCDGTESCDPSSRRCKAGSPLANGTACDADSSGATRDVCLVSQCQRSACGDGFADVGAGEACDDGNTTAGDGCSADCTSNETCGNGVVDTLGMLAAEACDDGNTVAGDTCSADCSQVTETVGPPPPTPPTAFRVVELKLVDPHIWVSVPLLGCRDITDNGLLGNPSVNDQFAASLNDNAPQDGTFDFNMLTVFRPLQLAQPSGPVDLVLGTCTTTAPTTMSQSQCSVGATGTSQSSTASNQSSGTCYQADSTTLTNSPKNYPDPNVVTSPCFVTSPSTTTVNVGGLVLTLNASRIAAQYSPAGSPTGLIQGVLSGFISEADAKATLFPSSIPLLGNQPLYKALADAKRSGSSCATHSDRDVGKGPNGEDGFWFYLNFTAQKVQWSD
jgi:cysteine-rich repeat protein